MSRKQVTISTSPKGKKPKTEKRRRPRVRVTNDLRAIIAVERFASARTSGKFKPIKDLADKYNRAPAVISRAIPRAFMEGVVEVRRTVEKPPMPDTDEDLEKRLLKKYTKLHKVIVIKTGDIAHDSDKVHEKLGLAMAGFIALGSVLQNRASVGVGSGRGVMNVLNWLKHFPDLRAKDVSLLSLTGSVYSTPNQKTKGMWHDSDRHVLEFAKHFLKENEPKQYLICHPLAYELSDLKRARSRIWLRSLDDPGHEASRKTVVPQLTHLLVGVGTVLDGHRFYNEANAKGNDQEPFLAPIHELLVNLVSLCEKAVSSFKHLNPFYRPAAEMSNFFFYVPPPRGRTVPNEDDLKGCIKEINAKLLSGMRDGPPRQSQFLVVAGTKEKCHALRALLDDDAYPVTYLCTDDQAAVEIVEGRA